MDDGAEGDGAGEEWGVVDEGYGEGDEVGEIVGAAEGFCGVDVEGCDGALVLRWARALGFFADGGEDEVGAWAVEVD